MPRETIVYVQCTLCGRRVKGQKTPAASTMRFPEKHKRLRSAEPCAGDRTFAPVIDRTQETERFTRFSESMSTALVERVYTSLIAYKQENDGNSPSLRWLQHECNIGSVSTVFKALLLLEEKGKVKLARGKYGARSIRVVGSYWMSPQEKENRYDDGK